MNGYLFGSDPEFLSEQVMLKRVVLFFGNAVGNAAVAMITAVVVAFIMLIAEVDWLALIIWLALLTFFVAVVLMTEVKFDATDLSPENAQKWLLIRMAGGSLVALMYGIAVYLLPENVEAHHVMYLVLILVTIVSLCATGFAVMPAYTYVISLVTILPMLVFLLFQGTAFYFGLAFNMMIVWGVLINKARMVSKSAIQALVTNEKLKTEITNHKKTQKKLDHMVNHDFLTGLPNRKHLLEQLTAMLAHQQRTKADFAVLFLDLDGFKKINDEMGHATGDWVLKNVAQLLKDILSKKQMVARIGGDEFVVLTPVDHDPLNADAVSALAEKIKQQLSKPIILPAGQQAQIGVSIGVIQADDAALSAEAMLQAADVAMYQNKKANKHD